MYKNKFVTISITAIAKNAVQHKFCFFFLIYSSSTLRSTAFISSLWLLSRMPCAATFSYWIFIRHHYMSKLFGHCGFFLLLLPLVSHNVSTILFILNCVLFFPLLRIWFQCIYMNSLHSLFSVFCFFFSSS